MHLSVVSALLLCLATTQFTASVSAIKATSLKLRSNPNVDLKLTKRDYITTTFRPNNETVFGFYVDVLVGTPPQFFSLAFSTSSTTWLPSPRNITAKRFCDTDATGNLFWSCYYDSFYQPNKSTTYKPKRGVLDNFYGTGLFAKGTWGSDVFKINQLTIPEVSFGLASNFTSSAELGLGVDFARTYSSYPSLPEVMVTEGVINSILYSIYVNDIRNDGGEIFFGAIDEAKYEGTLTTFKTDSVGRVTVKGVYWVDPDGTNSTLVDSGEIITNDVAEIQLGTPSLWVPNDVYRRLINSIPALTYATAYEAYIVDCAIDDADLGTVQFDLGDTIISVHTRQILVEYPTGSGTCVFTLYQTEKARIDSPDYILGTPFLRSAYTVFDYTNNKTSVAQSVFNSTSSTLREVPEGGIEAMPQRSGNPSSGTPTNTPSATPSSDPNAGNSPSPTVSVVSSQEDKAGVPVAAIVGGTLGGVAALIIAGVIIWLLMTRKKKKTESDMPFPPNQDSQPTAPNMGHPPPITVGYKPTVTTAQHGYPFPSGQPSQMPPQNVASPPTSYQENWGSIGFAGRTSGDGRPVSVVSGSTVGGYGQDLSSYGGHPGQSGQNGMPSPPLNATGVYGSYGYNGYNQY